MNKTFKITSGAVRVTDPCYGLDVWCSGELYNVKNGTWIAKAKKIKEEEGRIGRLIAKHESAPPRTPLAEVTFEVGVDSAQAGIFDLQYYKNYRVENTLNEGESYSDMCELTSGKEGWGVLPEGVVSKSGYGDGGYDCFIGFNDEDEIVAIEIIFIEED